MIFSPLRIKKTFKILSASGVAVFLFSCGGGGGPGAPTEAPVAPSVAATEPPLDTTVSGLATGIGGAAIGEGTVTLLNVQGNEVAKVPLKEDGTFEMPTKLFQSDSGVFRIRIETKKEDDVDLEGVVRIEAGQKDINPSERLINARTTLASQLAEQTLVFNEEIENEDAREEAEENLERALDFYVPILQSIDEARIEDALLEMEKMKNEKDINVYIQNTPALGEIIGEILDRSFKPAS